MLTETVCPDLPVSGASEPSHDSELFEVGIATILIDARDDKLPFLLRQEVDRPRFRVVREGYEENVAEEGH